jgi:hypothetical protein
VSNPALLQGPSTTVQDLAAIAQPSNPGPPVSFSSIGASTSPNELTTMVSALTELPTAYHHPISHEVLLIVAMQYGTNCPHNAIFEG